MSQTDRIEKHVDLRAPVARVWRAISDAREFGAWFGVRLDGAFEAGRPIKGTITTPGYEHRTAEFVIDRIDERAGVLAFRWHPFAIDPAVDYSHEPFTVVEFKLTEIATGTHLAITESGFDALPAARRDRAFAANSEGWTIQSKQIADYLATSA